MNLRIILVGLALTLLLRSATGTAVAQPPPGMPPPHGLFHLMGQSGISGDQQNLYVMAGGKILQYSIADLKLLKSVDLPKPVLPADLQTKSATKFPPPPPPMGGPHGLWTGEGYLYVLAGPVIYRYNIPALTLQNTVELPKPEPPQTGN